MKKSPEPDPLAERLKIDSSEGLCGKPEIKPWRSPSEEELAFISALLDRGLDEADVYREQLARASVRSTCICGCPTIESTFPLMFQLPLVASEPSSSYALEQQITPSM